MKAVRAKYANEAKPNNVVAPAQAYATPESLPPTITADPTVSWTSRPSNKVDFADTSWLVLTVAILLLGAVLRLYALELKPMHHDEGVNGFFITNLVRQGVYHYDPSNYHGPTLYYLALPFISMFGLETFSLRLLTAVAGIATILLIFDLKRYLGTIATLSAAMLLAVSPASVFYSRYFIHEQLFVLFTLGIVVAALRFYESGQAAFLLLASLSAALLFATKETAFVSLTTLGLAWFAARRVFSLLQSPLPYVRKRKARERAREARRDGSELQSFLGRLGGKARVVNLMAYAIALFVLVNVLFYSSFFTYWPGVKGALSSLQIWTKTGTSEFHGKAFGTYLNWLMQEEMPLILLSVFGAYCALCRDRVNRFAIFVTAWAFGILLAYSLIPYKTPWLMLNFVLPMALLAGYGIQDLCNRSWASLKAPIPMVLVVVIALGISVYQTFVLNYREYDNDKYPYVYAHTSRELTGLVNEIDRLARKAGSPAIGVSIASPENWPLPWYLRDYSRVGYAGTISKHYDSKDTPVVIGRESNDPKEDQTSQLKTVLGTEYVKVGTYSLRPGVRLALFARHDLTGNSK